MHYQNSSVGECLGVLDEDGQGVTHQYKDGGGDGDLMMSDPARFAQDTADGPSKMGDHPHGDEGHHPGFAGLRHVPSSSSSTTIQSSIRTGDKDDDIVVLQKDEVALDITDQVTPYDIDLLVAKQMAELSMQDREKIYSDIHGVSEKIKETPEFLERKLQELSKALENVSERNAYDLAKRLSEEYAENSQFQLSFLRADLFDASKAALRYTRHWQAKLDLFGQKMLVQDISQDDLDADTKEALHCGLLQYLPLRDRAGRLVHVSFVNPDSISLDAKMKRMFYMIMASNEDEETQRKGRVAVGYMAGQNAEPSRNDWQLGRLLNALPVRMEAIHLCHDSATTSWTPIFAVFKVVVCWFMRLRIREHFGSHRDCLFALQTFGIPIPNCFPISQHGNISVEDHRVFWARRRDLERLRRRGWHQSPTLSSDSYAIAGYDNETFPQETCVTPDPNLTNSCTLTFSTPSVSMESLEESTGKRNTKDGGAVKTTQTTNTTHPVVTASSAAVLGTSTSMIGVPGRNDVLLGRGKGFYQHTGNIRFRHVIEERHQRYDDAKTSLAKKKITFEVIRLVKEEGGGRFLKDDKKCGWLQVDDESARQKVAHAFRSLRAPSSTAAPNRQSTPSGAKTSFSATNPTGGGCESVPSKRFRLV